MDKRSRGRCYEQFEIDVGVEQAVKLLGKLSVRVLHSSSVGIGGVD